MKYYIVILIFFLAGVGCTHDPVKNINVSNNVIPFSANRFDEDLFSGDFSQPHLLREFLHHHYGDFYCDFVEQILSIGPCDNDSTVVGLKGFVSYPDMVELENAIRQSFPEPVIQKMNFQLEDALKRWNYFFPDSLVPRIVYMNSGLNYSAYSTDSVIAIGLDYFLGTEHPIVKSLVTDFFPQYIKEDMKQEYAVSNAIKNFVWHKCEQQDATPDDPDLLTMMIHHGKMMYVADALLPVVPDSIKLNWTKAQWEWALDNEKNTWKELAREDILFGKKFNENKRWFDFGPFTNARHVPQESPPQLGVWMGLNFVRAYMKAYPEVTLPQLLLEKDNQKILKAYKPYL